MGYIFSFEKLHVWQDSKKLVLSIYKITKSFPIDERFGLISQLRRASVSISSNIAEGCARSTSKDQARFYTIAYSSLMEVLNQIIISNELNYITEEDYLTTRLQIEKVGNKIVALKKYQQTVQIKH